MYICVSVKANKCLCLCLCLCASEQSVVHALVCKCEHMCKLGPLLDWSGSLKLLSFQSGLCSSCGSRSSRSRTSSRGYLAIAAVVVVVK